MPQIIYFVCFVKVQALIREVRPPKHPIIHTLVKRMDVFFLKTLQFERRDEIHCWRQGRERERELTKTDLCQGLARLQPLPGRASDTADPWINLCSASITRTAQHPTDAMKALSNNKLPTKRKRHWRAMSPGLRYQTFWPAKYKPSGNHTHTQITRQCMSDEIHREMICYHVHSPDWGLLLYLFCQIIHSYLHTIIFYY